MKITIEKSQGEYRVPSDDGYEDGAYYTDDKDDAIAVAKKVFGKDVEIKYRSVPEFVGGKYEKMKKESLDEAKVKGLCKQCGIKLSKISKDEGFCVECATPINESLDEFKKSNVQKTLDKLS